MPLPTLDATIAALAGADKDPDQPATPMALLSTLGVLTREHDVTPQRLGAGAIPHVSGALIESTADLVHRALIPDTGRQWVRSVGDSLRSIVNAP
ncbi:hypothetical protein [Rhodococcus sp. NPDC057529]|uniref:hypothetical protein n=1 Tax=Rhodococcus sp. NPDC057529 TaxID=3346158 RepID=UPI00367296D0